MITKVSFPDATPISLFGILKFKSRSFHARPFVEVLRLKNDPPEYDSTMTNTPAWQAMSLNQTPGCAVDISSQVRPSTDLNADALKSVASPRKKPPPDRSLYKRTSSPAVLLTQSTPFVEVMTLPS